MYVIKLVSIIFLQNRGCIIVLKQCDDHILNKHYIKCVSLTIKTVMFLLSSN